jgi:ATP-dependent Lon protease
VPWYKRTKERKDLLAAEKILNDDHYGPREGQGAHRRVPGRAPAREEAKGPILCFVGPPASARPRSPSRSRAATNRKFVRLSLGGVRDEAEVRGHRRTYIGAFPARSSR